MSLNGDQIEELRARVPLAYRPWDRPAAPVKAPTSEVSDVDDAARRLNGTLLNLARGEGDLADRIGYRAPGGNQKLGHAAADEKKRRETDAKFALDQARKALEERIRWLEEQIEGIKVERAAIAERRSQIADKVAAIDELKARLARGEKLDPNNPADQKLARRAGISPEDLRRADLDAFLTIQRAGALAEDRGLQARDAELARDQADYERDLDEAKDLAAQMEVPLRALMVGNPPLAGTYTLYVHALMTSRGETYTYYGITKRGWSIRFNEHTRAAAAQKSKRLLARTLNDLIDARAAELYGRTDDRAKLAGIISSVCGIGMSREDALAAEERLVDKYSLASKHPYGLNMIPGGLAGLSHARRFLRHS